METLGIIEKIKIEDKEFKAKVDTGADSSSIDLVAASKLNLGPITGFKEIFSANGKSLRPTIRAKLNVRGKTIRTTFTVMPRSKLKYKVLLGRKTLKRLGFLIDPAKK
jgi:hypothetical protein